MRRSIRHHGAFANSVLVCASLLLLLLTFEAALRFLGYNPFGEFFENQGRAIFLRPSANPQRQYEATPNARGYGWETTVAINSHGFRGREYAKSKAPGTYRIVVLGDSIAFGNRLAQDETYPAVLEALYQQDGRAVEVLNLGLGGYDTLQEVATLADIGLAFEPDLVILGYCINDIGISSGNRDYVERVQHYGHWMYRLRLAQWIRVRTDRIALKWAGSRPEHTRDSANQYSAYLADISQDAVLHEHMTSLRAVIEAQGVDIPFARDYTSATHLRRLRFALNQLHDLQRSTNSSFDVLVLSTPFLLQDDNARPVLEGIQRIIDHEAGRLGFVVMDLLPVFTAVGLDQLLITPDDRIHPNARAHRLVAERLFSALRAKP